MELGWQKKSLNIALFPLWSLWNKVDVLNFKREKTVIFKHGNVIRVYSKLYFWGNFCAYLHCPRFPCQAFIQNTSKISLLWVLLNFDILVRDISVLLFLIYVLEKDNEFCFVLTKMFAQHIVYEPIKAKRSRYRCSTIVFICVCWKNR